MSEEDRYSFGKRPKESEVTQTSDRRLSERRRENKTQQFHRRFEDELRKGKQEDLTAAIHEANRGFSVSFDSQPFDFVDGLLVGLFCGVLVPIAIYFGAKYWGLIA